MERDHPMKMQNPWHTYMHMHLSISTPHDLFDMPERTQEITDGGVWVEMVYGLRQSGDTSKRVREKGSSERKDLEASNRSKSQVNL